MNRKYFTLPFFLFLVLIEPLVAGAEALEVTEIVVVGAPGPLEPAVRGAFVEAVPGTIAPQETLEEALSLAQERLVAWGYFSSVDVTLVASKKQPGTARVVVEVVPGFTGRFGGGAAWGQLTVLDALDSADDWSLALGANRQSLAWGRPFLGWPGSRGRVEAGNLPWAWTDETGARREDHLVGASATLVQELGWGWSVTVLQQTWQDFAPDWSGSNLRTVQGVEVGWARAAGFSPDRGGLVRARGSVVFPGPLVREEGEARAYLALVPGLKLALRAAGATQQGPFTARDAWVLSGVDGLRQAFDPADLDRTKLWSSAELRWAAVQLPFFGFSTLAVEPALVADLGRGWNEGDGRAAWDAGVALRLYWSPPVDVPVRLELTWDDRSRIWYGLAVENPF